MDDMMAATWMKRVAVAWIVVSAGVALAAAPDVPGGIGKPEKPAVPGKPETVQSPDWAKGAMAEKLREMQAQFRKDQQSLISKYRELVKESESLTDEERAKIREQLKADRSALMEAQKVLREDIKTAFQEFRKAHAEHQDLVDAAQEKARERAKQRRGDGE